MLDDEEALRHSSLILKIELDRHGQKDNRLMRETEEQFIYYITIDYNRQTILLQCIITNNQTMPNWTTGNMKFAL